MVCDICGAPACSVARDIKETGATEQGYITWEPHGVTRTRCAAHHEPSKHIMLDGTIEYSKPRTQRQEVP